MTDPFRLPKFLIAAAVLCLFSFGVVFAQNSSSKSVQMDPDWEKIRDAQVVMLKKKEAELDRMKEELLLRAQPGSQPQAGVAEIEAEFKKREAEWMQKSDQYENEITLFKVKTEEQKAEIDTLRKQLVTPLNNPQPEQKEKTPSSLLAAPADSAELKNREAQLQVREKQLADIQIELETKMNQTKSFRENAAQFEKDKAIWERQRNDWEYSKSQSEQKLEAGKKELDMQKKTIETERAALQFEQQNHAQKTKELQELQREKNAGLERESNWKNREQELLQTQSKSAAQISTLQSNLSGEQADFSRKEIEWKSQLDSSAQKLIQTENQLKAAQINLQEKATQAVSQNESRAKDWSDKQTELQKRQNELATLEAQLKKKSADLETQAAEIDQNSKKLEQARVQFTAQTKSLPANAADQNPALAELKNKLEQSERENEKWREGKLQIEKNWADFVNKEMEYQMEIKDLQQRLAAAQTSLTAKPQVQSPTVTSNVGRDWKVEAQQVVEGRRALAEEKASLYRQLTQDRQQFDQAQVQFSREQRMFQEHIRNEEARLERLRRQTGSKPV